MSHISPYGFFPSTDQECITTLALQTSSDLQRTYQYPSSMNTSPQTFACIGKMSKECFYGAVLEHESKITYLPCELYPMDIGLYFDLLDLTSSVSRSAVKINAIIEKLFQWTSYKDCKSLSLGILLKLTQRLKSCSVKPLLDKLLENKFIKIIPLENSDLFDICFECTESHDYYSEIFHRAKRLYSATNFCTQPKMEINSDSNLKKSCLEERPTKIRKIDPEELTQWVKQCSVFQAKDLEKLPLLLKEEIENLDTKSTCQLDISKRLNSIKKLICWGDENNYLISTQALSDLFNRSNHNIAYFCLAKLEPPPRPIYVIGNRNPKQCYTFKAICIRDIIKFK